MTDEEIQEQIKSLQKQMTALKAAAKENREARRPILPKSIIEKNADHGWNGKSYGLNELLSHNELSQISKIVRGIVGRGRTLQEMTENQYSLYTECMGKIFSALSDARNVIYEAENSQK